MKKLLIIVLPLLLVGCSAKAPVMDYNGANDIAYALQNEWTGRENTSERIDCIVAKAEKDAENITDVLTDQALAYLAVNFSTDPFGGNLVMEACMYFGALLDEAFDDSDIKSQVGWNAFKTIKYVYRDMESEADAENAKQQTINGLLELGYLTEN
jgi:hypothetical protein